MQYLKDSVKKSIEEAALNEFKQNGYKNTSIREIVKKLLLLLGISINILVARMICMNN